MKINSAGSQNFGRLYPGYDFIVKKMGDSITLTPDCIKRINEINDSKETHIWLEDNGNISYKISRAGNKATFEAPRLTLAEKLRRAVYYVSSMKHALDSLKEEKINESSQQKDCPSSVSDLFPNGCHEHNPWFPLDD